MNNTLAALLATCLSWQCSGAAASTAQPLDQAVRAAITPLMQQQHIPGMAVAVVWHGHTYVYPFGVADLSTHRAVTADTLFEIGSVTKTFNGVLSAMAIARGEVQLDDAVSAHWPALNQPQWQGMQMVHLATYTAGGLPLQLPDTVTDEASMLQFYQQWQPSAAPGKQRDYSNASIGLFGHLAVQKTGLSYTAALQQQLLTPLRLSHVYFGVPAAQQSQYAYGYDEGQSVRNTPGMLSVEAGGLTASVGDLARWLELHMNPAKVTDPVIQQAMQLAQQGYAKAGDMQQGLGWERLDYPVTLAQLKASTDPSFVRGTAAQLLQPATPANPKTWLHKTGATAGFAAYVAMVPAEQVGVVLLANKRYPNALRVTIAKQLVTGLTEGTIAAPAAEPHKGN